MTNKKQDDLVLEDYRGQRIHALVVKDKVKKGLCDKCNKRVRYLYDVTMKEAPFWFAECSSCGHIGVEFDEK